MKITKLVPRIIYGPATFNELPAALDQLFASSGGYALFIIDAVHNRTGLRNRLKPSPKDLVIDVDVSDHEPRTGQVDAIRDQVLRERKTPPSVVVGIGGGSAMDIAKAVSVMLTNKGSSADYQGYDLPTEKAIPKLAVPTLSGTGAEATRTAVLVGPIKKLGINSDQSIYDAIIMDPELLATVDREQEFYTAMDCFIHCVESLNGSLINEIGKGFASKSKEMMEGFFLKEKNYGELMVASYLGGCSVANAEVGVCHALSYGLSLVFGVRHGLANSIVFNQLGEFYGPDVEKFHAMLRHNNITLPTRVAARATPAELGKMIEMTYRLERALTHALGADFRSILTREKIIELYAKM